MSESNFDTRAEQPATQSMSGERDDPRPPSQQRIRPKLIVRRLWAGGVGAAVVVALVVLVGVLLFSGVFGVPVPDAADGAGPRTAAVVGYVSMAGLVAIAVTAALHAMLLLLPRPLQFFNWVCGLVVVVAMLVPFTMAMPQASRLAVAAINFVAGVCLLAMLNSVSASSVLVVGPSAVEHDPAARD